MTSDTLQDMLRTAGPDAGRKIPEGRVGQEIVSHDLPTAIDIALAQLPSGRLRKKNDKLLVKGLTFLLEKIPTDHPMKAETTQKVQDALSRCGTPR